MDVKKLITLTIIAFGAVATLNAQSYGTTYHSTAQHSMDTVLLSQSTQGDYTVERMLVKQTNTTGDEFSLKYKISVADLNAAYKNNSNELSSLTSFINSIKEDPNKKITRYRVTGYASPDGSMSVNERLAMERAVNFREYLDKNYSMDDYPAMIDAVAEPWYATAPWVSSMNVPNKSEVLSIVDSSAPASSVEAQLKRLPQSWTYMARNILPTMRSVELEVMYNSWKEIEVYTQNYTAPAQVIVTQMAEPKRERFREEYIEDYVDDGASGLIYMMDDNPLDYEEKWKMRERGGFAMMKERFRFR